MTFDEIMRETAHRAEKASRSAMSKLASGRVKHEDDLTGVLVGRIEEQFDNAQIGGIVWDTAILTHRASGEEGIYGADLLIHVSLNTPEFTYSKGVLVQAKRIGPGQNMSARDHGDLVGQCNKMLKWTSSAFVVSFDAKGMRAASATKIAGSSERALYDQSDWTAYRFFLELFRCPIGDPRITSANVADLQPRHGISIKGSGSLHADRPGRRMD